MKEMNRREFLTLSGASVALLALAACGGAPSTPAVPTTGEEAKVLEAIKKYRAAAGVEKPLALDNGLKPAVELVVKIAKGEMKFDEKAMEALAKAEAGYDGVGAPIGIVYDHDTGYMMPVYAYSEDVEKMAQNLLNLADKNLKSPAITLVNIQTFEYNGTTFWVALTAKSKK